MNKEQALESINRGFIAAIFVGLVTTGFGIYGLWIGLNSHNLWNDVSFGIFDGILIFICSYFIYRKSRLASTLFFIYFIMSKIYLSVLLGKLAGLGLGLIFIYFFFRAMQGTFAYHKIEKAENIEYKNVSKWVIYSGFTIGAIFLSLIVFGVLLETGYIKKDEDTQEIADAFHELGRIKNESEWAEHVESSYILFFSKLHDVSMKEHGYDKNAVDSNQKALLGLSDFMGRCNTQYIKNIYTNPSKLYEAISKANAVELKQAKDFCHAKIGELTSFKSLITKGSADALKRTR